MKTKLTAVALLISLLSHSQNFSISIPVGVSNQHCLTAGTSFQYKLGAFLIEAGFTGQATSKVNKGNLWWSRLGANVNVNELNSIELCGGVARNSYGQEKSELNNNSPMGSAFWVHSMKSRPEAAIIGGLTVTKEVSYISAGLRLTFMNHKKNGCPSTW